jgi:hypothetical protein
MRVGRGQQGRDLLFRRVGGIWVRPVLLHGQRTSPNYPSHGAVVRKCRNIEYSLANDCGYTKGS